MVPADIGKPVKDAVVSLGWQQWGSFVSLSELPEARTQESRYWNSERKAVGRGPCGRSHVVIGGETQTACSKPGRREHRRLICAALSLISH